MKKLRWTGIAFLILFCGFGLIYWVSGYSRIGSFGDSFLLDNYYEGIIRRGLPADKEPAYLWGTHQWDVSEAADHFSRVYNKSSNVTHRRLAMRLLIDCPDQIISQRWTRTAIDLQSDDEVVAIGIRGAIKHDHIGLIERVANPNYILSTNGWAAVMSIGYLSKNPALAAKSMGRWREANGQEKVALRDSLLKWDSVLRKQAVERCVKTMSLSISDQQELERVFIVP